MRIEYPLGIPPKHPIQEFKFSTSLQTIEIGDHSLRLSTIEDLEPAIDQVFEWLSLNALPQSEMENLAPFFGKLWPSAIALAEKLAAIFKRSSSNRQNLIELGCGLGLPGLIAKKFGVEATLTDNHPCVPSFLEKNLAYNDIDSVKYFLLS
ncbi:MAG: hypothetical protein NT027_20715, partial [Proteobacteria bacterium]|nr:hypothetical protein [Pseudomonadota bacterium]